MTTNSGARQTDGSAGNGSGCAIGRGQTIIALHCSGADGSQWRMLRAAVGADCVVRAPSAIGSGDGAGWSGERRFTLLDEARPIIEMIDVTDGPVHLVGHSYGGGVALKAAMARPERIASLSLYEPSAFHDLRQLGDRASAELAEILALAGAVSHGLVTGAYQQAACAFVDYWNGDGTWRALRPAVREGLIAWLAKAPLEFQALLDDDTPLHRYQRLTCPVLVMRGENALPPSRLVVTEIARHLPMARLEVVPGAGHMGPLTHGGDVIRRIIANIGAAAPADATASVELAA